MLKIALIGAGQLGSRHLQALALFDRPARIFVVDPFEASLATARERFEQVKQDRVEARFTMRFEELPAALDAAVVATGADTRRAALERLFARSRVDVALLEKVLFQRIADYDAVAALLSAQGTHAWVNCAQRLWPFFRDLRPRLLGGANINVTVTGASWGLGCNAIHNLDLLSYLVGEPQCRLEAQLDAGSIPSKRAGFIEFTGTLHAFGARGNRVTQTSWRAGSAPFAFEVQSEALHAFWRVGEPTMRLADAAGDWQWRELETHVPYQSQLTHVVLAEMINRRSSVLPSYAESAALHVKMLEAFLAHLRRAPGDACAIT